MRGIFTIPCNDVILVQNRKNREPEATLKQSSSYRKNVKQRWFVWFK